MTLLRPELYRPGTFDEWLRETFLDDDFFAPTRNLRSSRGNRFAHLSVDLYEDGGGFHAILELPGVTREDVNVELNNSVVTVSGEHTDKVGETESSYEFRRSLAVPDGVDPARISAEMKDGLLHLTLPKKEESKARSIEVN